MEHIKTIIRFGLGIIIILLAVLASIVSTGLSISYFQSLTNNDTLSFVLFGFVVLLQLMVLIGSIAKGIIYKRTPQHYYVVLWFTRICFVISVLSTISFFNQISVESRTKVIKDLLYFIPVPGLNSCDWIVTNLTNLTLVWLSCIIIDLMSMYFPAIGSDLITGISTRDKIDIRNKSYPMKIYELLTFKPKQYIDKKCIEYGLVSNEIELAENEVSKKKLAENKVSSEIKLAENEVSNDLKLAEKVSNIDIDNDSEVSNLKLAKPTEKKVFNLADKKVSKKIKLAENKVSLSEEVSNYIKANYEINDTIKTKDLLTEFNLTKNNWYKIKKELNIIETNGTKTKRII